MTRVCVCVEINVCDYIRDIIGTGRRLQVLCRAFGFPKAIPWDRTTEGRHVNIVYGLRCTRQNMTWMSVAFLCPNRVVYLLLV